MGVAVLAGAGFVETGETELAEVDRVSAPKVEAVGEEAVPAFVPVPEADVVFGLIVAEGAPETTGEATLVAVDGGVPALAGRSELVYAFAELEPPKVSVCEALVLAVVFVGLEVGVDADDATAAAGVVLAVLSMGGI